MSPTEQLLGEPVAESIRETVCDRVQDLDDRGIEPTLGTVLMSDDPGDERFMALKHAACDDIGIATQAASVDPDAPAKRVYRAIDELSGDPEVSAVFVQTPLPDHVEL